MVNHFSSFPTRVTVETRGESALSILREPITWTVAAAWAETTERRKLKRETPDDYVASVAAMDEPAGNPARDRFPKQAGAAVFFPGNTAGRRSFPCLRDPQLGRRHTGMLTKGTLALRC